MQESERFESVEQMLLEASPSKPVYCVYPHIYERSTKGFLEGFPGRTLYAVKANNHPLVVAQLYNDGVRHFDCASVEEVALVNSIGPDATNYYMNPVRHPGDAKRAQDEYGVRHFVVDHHSGLQPLLDELDVERSVIFARMAVYHESALESLSIKYGAKQENIPALMNAIRDAGAEAALAFNVGTGVMDPAAYQDSMRVAAKVLGELDFKVRLVDIGGGFPKSYPGLEAPELTAFFERVNATREELPLADDGELMSEPGRALSAPGLSAVTKVLLRKTDRIYLNDGLYGAFWELRFKGGHDEYPFRVFRDGKPLHGETRRFRIFGPTCDSTDELPAAIHLPADINVGDYIEFGSIGAYSLSGRTDFNGFYSDRVVSISGPDSLPPGA